MLKGVILLLYYLSHCLSCCIQVCSAESGNQNVLCELALRHLLTHLPSLFFGLKYSKSINSILPHSKLTVSTRINFDNLPTRIVVTNQCSLCEVIIKQAKINRDPSAPSLGNALLRRSTLEQTSSQNLYFDSAS